MFVGLLLCLRVLLRAFKLELPSISQVRSQSAVAAVPWYPSQSLERPTFPSERLPALTYPNPNPNSHPQPDPYRGTSQDSSSASTASNAASSVTALTEYSQPHDKHSPSSVDGEHPPTLALARSEYHPEAYPPPSALGGMNQTQPYMDVHSSHLASSQPYSQAPTESVSHYSHYPPLLHHHGSYGHGSSYPPYGYANGVSSPATSQPMSNALAPPMQTTHLPLQPPMAAPTSSAHSYPATTSYPQPQRQPVDATGQISPPGAKPKVSATLWEDEGTLCYQIEAKGICVARRDDNHMINGTKLLNVAGMTRGRRDGILKSEKTRKVVKIGPMHLKGVWIPFERALDFANKENITDILYPLFVHNLKEICVQHNPDSLPNGTIQAERRRLEAPPISRMTPTSQQAPLHHHHSLSGSHIPQVSQSLTPQPRPPLDRAHTFPTPPTSASSLMAITHPSSSYEWSGQHLQGPPSLTVEPGMSTRSLPTTPATTPSGSIHYGHPGYESKYYPPPTSQPQYTSQPMQPMSAPNGTTQGDPADSEYVKPEYAKSEYVKSEYVNDNSTAYSSNRNSFSYPSNPTSSLAEPPQISPEITSTPQPNGIERAPSRQGTAWAPPTYPTSQQRTSVYSVVSDTRGSTAAMADPYGTPPANASAYPPIKSSNKRGRDDDDNEPAHTETQREPPTYEYKRRKTISDPNVNGVVGASVGLQSVTTGAVRRR